MNVWRILTFTTALFCTTHVFASTERPAKHVDLDTSPDAIKKGAVIAVEVCSLCHSLKYLRYRELTQIGLEQDVINKIRIDRSADDKILARFSADHAMKAFGMVPPDLSVIAKATKNGAMHVYSVLTSFHEDANGKIENAYFNGIKMPDVLGMSVEVDPDRKQLLDDRAKNVSSFLEWLADPRANERKTMGFWVLSYLVILTLLLYLVKRRVWARLK